MLLLVLISIKMLFCFRTITLSSVPANPGELPDLKKIKVKGKDTWDDSERLEFLEEYVKNTILPKIKPVLQDVSEEDTPF